MDQVVDNVKKLDKVDTVGETDKGNNRQGFNSKIKKKCMSSLEQDIESEPGQGVKSDRTKDLQKKIKRQDNIQKINKDYLLQLEKDSMVGHRQRLKEKFLHLSEHQNSALHDREILELLLFYVYPRRDVSGLSRQLLSVNKSLYNTIYMDKEHPMLTKNLYLLFKLIRCVMEKTFKEKCKKQDILSSWSSLLAYLKDSMSNLSIEYFRVLFLDVKYMLIADEFLSSGNEYVLVLSPRELIKKVLFYNAHSIVIIHNHPNGEALPSENDINTTKELINACSVFEIGIIDHIIVAQQKIYSFKENGLM